MAKRGEASNNLEQDKRRKLCDKMKKCNVEKGKDGDRTDSRERERKLWGECES